jgi:TolB-like protein/Flp pilus assembly protein TadD
MAWGVPVGLWEELKRRNVVRVAIAYIVVSWLVVQAADTLFPLLQVPEWTVRFVVGLLILGFPLALILSWAYELTPEGLRKTSEVEPADSVTHATGRKLDRVIIVVLALAVVFLVVDDFVLDETAAPSAAATAPAVTSSESSAAVVTPVQPESDSAVSGAENIGSTAALLQNSVAVLPFANLSPDDDNAYFAIGLHDEILNQLAKLSNLSVISRTSMMRYQDSDLSVPEIAQELNVETVMEGSVRYAGDQIRVTVQLIDGSTDQHLWSETYQERFEDIFAIESDIAMNVANAMNAEFSTSEQAEIERVPTDSTAAYTYYLQARSILFTGASFDPAITLLERALELDPDFADALGQYSLIKARQVVNTTQGAAVPAEQIIALEDEARSMAERALELNPGSVSARATLRAFDIPRWRWSEFAAAVTHEDEPNLAAAEQWVFAWMGRADEAVRIGERSVALRPGEVGPPLFLGVSQSYAGDRVLGNRTLAAAANGSPADALIRAWIAYNQIVLGDLDDAFVTLQLVEQMLGDDPPVIYLPELAYAYSRIGRSEDAQRNFDVMRAIENPDLLGAGGWATAYLAIDDQAQALEQLEIVAQRAANHEPDAGMINAMNLRLNYLNDPRLEQPEFVDVLSRIRGD